MIIVVFRNALAQHNRQGKIGKQKINFLDLTHLNLATPSGCSPQNTIAPHLPHLHLCHHQDAQNNFCRPLSPWAFLVSGVSATWPSFKCLWMLVAWKLSSWNQWLVANLDRHKPKLLRMRTWNEIWKLLEVMVHIWTMTIRKVDLQ